MDKALDTITVGDAVLSASAIRRSTIRVHCAIERAEQLRLPGIPKVVDAWMKEGSIAGSFRSIQI